MQCQETCWMAIDTINLPDEGGCRGAIAKNLCPLLPLLWLNAFSFGNQIHNSQLLLVCPNNVWPVRQGGQNHMWPTSGPGGDITPTV